MKFKNILSIFVASFFFAANAQATTFSADLTQSGVFGLYNTDQAERVGTMVATDVSLDDATNVLTWTTQFTPNSKGEVANSFWVVTNSGPTPTANDIGELAIFYFDATDSNNPVLTAYAYNGQPAPVGDYSFEDGNGDGITGDADFIFSSLTNTHNPAAINLTAEENAGVTTLGFSIDLDDPTVGIANHNPLYPGDSAWEGVSFTDTVGFWFHPAIVTASSYNANGSLNTFVFSAFDPNNQRGSFDGTLSTTNAVPEPSSVMLLLAGLFAGVAFRRKQA